MRGEDTLSCAAVSVRSKVREVGATLLPILFQKMTIQNPNAVYSCVNLSDAYAPTEIKRQSVCLDGDIGAILKKIS